jgi:hypothetical protein
MCSVPGFHKPAQLMLAGAAEMHLGQALMTFERINQNLPQRKAQRSVSLVRAGAEATLDA